MPRESATGWEPSQRLGFAARALALDRVAAEVASALEDIGVPAIVLKGPALIGWLYRDGSPRLYGDIDLLVPPGEVQRSQDVLGTLGFRYAGLAAAPGASLPPGLGWVRNSQEVDLHGRLVGIGIDPARAWELLWAETEVKRIGGSQLRVLSPEARTLHIALHAAQHGPAWSHPLEDLQRALDQLPRETWDGAARLAQQLQATAAFAAGLRLLASGAATANRLRLPTGRSVEAALRAVSAPPMALGLEVLFRTPGFRKKGALIVRELLPSPKFLRIWTPIARRGPIGLGIAYLWRLAWALGGTVPAVTLWLRIRRQTRRKVAHESDCDSMLPDDRSAS